MKLVMIVSAWRDLIDRYREKWRMAWANRHEFDRPNRTPEEAEFLPAALSVQDTPVSPMMHWGMRGIAIFFVLALAASIVFKIDVVVSAQGVLIPSGHVKTIQALESGVVRRIAVSEGQKIKAGDILVELFSPGVSTDSARFLAERDAALLELTRLQSLLDLLSDKSVPEKNHDLDAESGELLNIRYREFLDKKARADAEVAKREAELSSATESLNKVRESIPRLSIKAADYKELEADGYVSRHSALDQAQLLADARADAVILRSRVSEVRASLNEAKQARLSLISEIRRTALEQQRDNRLRLATAEQELAKYQHRDELMLIRSPIDGEVSNLMTYTVGGVVAAAQTLMSIVPEGSSIEVEAVVDNKDIGHVTKGQPAQVKVESFPFTRYGLLSGEVLGITASALNDEKKGLIYKARIALPDDITRRQMFPYPLVSGMNATVEMHIGKRRVIEYFLSPLMVSVAEAARER